MSNQPPSKAPASLKTVIFDLGGVILRTDDLAPRSALAAQVGMTYAELDSLVFASPVARQAEEGLASPEAVWEHVRQTAGLAPEALRGFRRAFFGGDQVDMALVELIRGLRPTYLTALLSNTWIIDLDRFIEEDLRIPAGTFDLVISSAAVGLAKPKAEIFQLALARCQASPQQALFVDDNTANIRAAQALGMHTIHFRSPQQARAELLAYVQGPGSSL
jgi:putative hydrolase of the HAD superfamily